MCASAPTRLRQLVRQTGDGGDPEADERQHHRHGVAGHGPFARAGRARLEGHGGHRNEMQHEEAERARGRGGRDPKPAASRKEGRAEGGDADAARHAHRRQLQVPPDFAGKDQTGDAQEVHGRDAGQAERGRQGAEHRALPRQSDESGGGDADEHHAGGGEGEADVVADLRHLVALHGDEVGREDGEAADQGAENGAAPVNPQVRSSGAGEQVAGRAHAEHARDDGGRGPAPVMLEGDAVENAVQRQPPSTGEYPAKG